MAKPLIPAISAMWLFCRNAFDMLEIVERLVLRFQPFRTPRFLASLFSQAPEMPDSPNIAEIGD